MRKFSSPQRQMRWTLIGLVICAVAAATLGLAWPTGAYYSDPRSNAVISHVSPQASPSPVAPVEHTRHAEARGVLAQRLGVPADSLTFVSEEAVNWPDTSLGCPKPGYVYAKVIVPGYRITFAYDGENYEVHTALKSGVGYNLPPVSCEGGLSYDRLTDDPAR